MKKILSLVLVLVLFVGVLSAEEPKRLAETDVHNLIQLVVDESYNAYVIATALQEVTAMVKAGGISPQDYLAFVDHMSQCLAEESTKMYEYIEGICVLYGLDFAIFRDATLQKVEQNKQTGDLPRQSTGLQLEL